MIAFFPDWCQYVSGNCFKQSLMPSSHLLRAPCDKWVYDFPYDFSGTVGGYGPRASCDFLYGSSDWSGKAAGSAKIVRKSCGAGAVAVQFPQIPHRNRMALVRDPYRGRAEIVR